MQILAVIAVAVVGYFVYKCVEKSNTDGSIATGEVQTWKQYESQDDFPLNVTYHNHDYSKRGGSVRESAGLYGTVRRTFISPSGNMESVDGS